MAYAYEHDDHEAAQPSGLRSRLRDFFGGLGRSRHDGYEYDEEYDEPARPAATFSRGNAGATPRPQFRVSTVSQGSITVMPASSFADAQKAADRLKQGEPQIVNFERTAPEIAERLIDFLNGITYALDGFVEKVGERVFLFTPANVAIHADAPEATAPPKSFFDRL